MVKNGVWIECARCKSPAWLPQALHEAARASEGISFCCAYGHTQHFPKGQTDTDRLRRERNNLKQRLAEKDDEITRQRGLRELERRTASAYKGQATKLRNRAKNGVCPCCSRSFQNLARHMETKHPRFAEPPLKVVEGGKR